MIELKAITYEESRLEYFRKQRDSAKRRMNYWCGAKQADRVGWMEASDRASEASAQYNFYKDALEALAAQPKWISVEERLPNDHGNFLTKIHCEKGDWIEVNTFDHTEKEWWHDAGNRTEEATEFVTHWMPMPIPEPQKEDA